MTLDDLEQQSSGLWSFGDFFRLRHTFQDRIAPKSLQIGLQDNYVHTDFSELIT